MPDLKKIELIKQLVESAERSLRSAKQLLFEITGKAPKSDLKEKAKNLSIIEEGKIIEGIFDGENMIGPDEKKYPIPPNYASKSKLVQGDSLKLTVMPDGSFIFKQIGPIERKKVIGVLNSEGDKYKVLAEGKSYGVLSASVSYFKVQVGDKVTLVVPKEGESHWGAIENVVTREEGQNQSIEKESLKVKKDVSKGKDIKQEGTLVQDKSVNLSDTSKKEDQLTVDQPEAEKPTETSKESNSTKATLDKEKKQEDKPLVDQQKIEETQESKEIKEEVKVKESPDLIKKDKKTIEEKNEQIKEAEIKELDI